MPPYCDIIQESKKTYMKLIKRQQIKDQLFVMFTNQLNMNDIHYSIASKSNVYLNETEY